MTYTPPPHLSPSGLATWRHCQVKWWEHYMEDHPPAPPTIAMVRGSFVHAVLETLMALPEEARTEEVARSVASTVWRSWTRFGGRADFAMLGLTPREQDEFGRGAWGSICTALEMAVPRLDPVAVELPIEMNLGGVPFKGYIDLVAQLADGTLTVNDWKTGERPAIGRPWSKGQADEKMLQPLLYAAALRGQGHVVSTVALIFIPAEGRAGWLTADATDDALDGAVASLKEAWGEILHHVANHGEGIKPSPGALCGWCEFVTICPQGEAEVRIRHSEGRNVGPARDALGF